MMLYCWMKVILVDYIKFEKNVFYKIIDISNVDVIIIDE